MKTLQHILGEGKQDEQHEQPIVLNKATHSNGESYLIFCQFSERSTSFCFFTVPVLLFISQNENKG